MQFSKRLLIKREFSNFVPDLDSDFTGIGLAEEVLIDVGIVSAETAALLLGVVPILALDPPRFGVDSGVGSLRAKLFEAGFEDTSLPIAFGLGPGLRFGVVLVLGVEAAGVSNFWAVLLKQNSCYTKLTYDKFLTVELKHTYCSSW